MNSNLSSKYGILLDVDGVLIDSYAAFQSVWGSWASRHNLDFDLVWRATHGKRPVDTIRDVAPHVDAEEEYLHLQHLASSPQLNFPAIEGAGGFLRSFPPELWALVASGHEEQVRKRFNKARLPQPIHIVDGLQVSKGKPRPECYELGAKKLGLNCDQCLSVEDAPAGIDAALAAGCYVVAISTTHDVSSLVHAHVTVGSLMEARLEIDQWVSDVMNA
jgi:sugar-phosphatase